MFKITMEITVVIEFSPINSNVNTN